MFRFGLMLAFWFSALPAGAKDFYIAANQAGAGTGTGCSSAKSYTWFNNTASWGTGAAQIGPGTTVHLCGTFVGTPGQQLLTVRGTGTSAGPITINFETNAILPAPYCSQFGPIPMSAQSSIFITRVTHATIKNT